MITEISYIDYRLKEVFNLNIALDCFYLKKELLKNDYSILNEYEKNEIDIERIKVEISLSRLSVPLPSVRFPIMKPPRLINCVLTNSRLASAIFLDGLAGVMGTRVAGAMISAGSFIDRIFAIKDKN